MKKILFFFILVGLYLSGINLANAIGTGMYTTCTNGDYAELQNGVPAYCETWEDICYSGYAVRNCTKCESVGPRQYVITPDGPINLPNGQNVMFNSCDLYICSSTNCVSDSSWNNANTGYQKKVSRSCVGNTCQETASYRCSAGYYGTSTNGTSGCTRCPASEDNVRGTSVAGATAQTNCYIPSGTSFSNNTGSGTYTGNSYYCN